VEEKNRRSLGVSVTQSGSGGHVEETVSDQENELTSIESDIKYTKEKLSDLRSDVETLEQRANQQSTLVDERESLSAEIESLRTRRERMKSETREAFSEAISEIIDTFDTSYENARLTSNFDLVVARDGREAPLDALSEGEIVLLGLVAALAGYEAYDVAERVPVILVDSLGGSPTGTSTCSWTTSRNARTASSVRPTPNSRRSRATRSTPRPGTWSLTRSTRQRRWGTGRPATRCGVADPPVSTSEVPSVVRPGPVTVDTGSRATALNQLYWRLMDLESFGYRSASELPRCRLDRAGPT
jgi:hypothetical protein